MISEREFQRFLEAVANEDFRDIAGRFEENAVFSDPLFPKSPIKGNTYIVKAFERVLALADESTFEITSFCTTDRIAMGEVRTYHRYKGGFEANYMQAFVLEFSANGKIQRANVYNDLKTRDIINIISSPLRKLVSS